MAPIAADTREMLLALEPRPESARLARRALHAHGLREDIEHTVTLLATEIVGNAVATIVWSIEASSITSSSPENAPITVRLLSAGPAGA